MVQLKPGLPYGSPVLTGISPDGSEAPSFRTVSLLGSKLVNKYSSQGIFCRKLLEFRALQSGISYVNLTAPVASPRLSNILASEFYSDELLITLTSIL